jgi:glycosidase
MTAKTADDRSWRAFQVNSKLLLFVLILVATRLGAGEARIDRVEPPNWWAGQTRNPVRLMITGTNLFGAKVLSSADLLASNVTANAAGTYAFADVFIPRDAVPGPRSLRFGTSSGEAAASFYISEPLLSQNRFAGFTPDDTIYLIMPDRFANGDPTNDNPTISPGLMDRSKSRYYHGGDFQGIINHLPYLRNLGVTALWLTPWYDNVNHLNRREKYNRDNQRTVSGEPITDYHGYGAVDFYGVEEHFGDMSKLRELADAVHQSKMKLIQDQVANHTGPYHPWVSNPPTPTWFNGTPANHLDNSWQTWTLAVPNPPQDKLRSTLEGWFINVLPDLNQNDPETAAYLIQNSLWWVGMTGVDAIRQDTLPYVPRSYWAKWTAAIKEQYPQVTILGEMWDAKPELVSFFQGGRARFDGVDSGVDTLFDFPLCYAIRDVFAKGQPMTRLDAVLGADSNYVNARTLVTFLGLHDLARFMNEPGATIDGLQLAFAFLLTTRGTPLIYYGDEIGMPGGGDPDNRRDFPGGWPEDSRNAFTPEGRTSDEASVHQYVRKLLALRRELEPLRRGDTLLLQSKERTRAYARVTHDSGVLVVLNVGNQTEIVRLELPAALASQSQWFDQLGEDAAINAPDGVLTLRIPPRQAMLLTAQPPRVAERKADSETR